LHHETGERGVSDAKDCQENAYLHDVPSFKPATKFSFSRIGRTLMMVNGVISKSGRKTSLANSAAHKRKEQEAHCELLTFDTTNRPRAYEEMKQTYRYAICATCEHKRAGGSVPEPEG